MLQKRVEKLNIDKFNGVLLEWKGPSPVCVLVGRGQYPVFQRHVQKIKFVISIVENMTNSFFFFFGLFLAVKSLKT